MQVVKAMQNFRNGNGWEHRCLDTKEELRIQEEVRGRNIDVMSECLADALEVLVAAGYTRPTWEQALGVAVPLFERRTPHVSRVYDETLKALVAESRDSVTREGYEVEV